MLNRHSHARVSQVLAGANGPSGVLGGWNGVCMNVIGLRTAYDRRPALPEPEKAIPMSSEIRLAFAHPSERSEATASRGPLDRISLRDHIVEVEIGAFQAERGTTQRICFNIVVEVRPISDPIDDDVDRILSYDRVTEAIAFELAAERDAGMVAVSYLGKKSHGSD